MRDDGIPAGWFDTRRRGTRRWWDGTRWTEHIQVRGRETTLADDGASVRRQLLTVEVVLAVVLVVAILVAFLGGLPVVVVRPVIVAVGAALVFTPFAIRRQLRFVGVPVRRAGVPPLR
ncbi:hypothetical protein RN51_01893 [Microbacterium oxydans]|uniref:Uncharacterized protein n=1 Tax=Microbacterium oxydans TaxID=82380 RepID=A0A0F0KQ42_9MICO|nr:DUF2510 domain-containing protein [Microbacterium oxydans]KJL22579.1 hypothetical protein RN51_01893 [Microbacterium oxydans]